MPGHDTDTAVIKDDPEVLPMFREAMKGQAGRKCGDNITQLTKADKGTSKAYTLSRLQKDNPEIAYHRRPVDTIGIV